MTTRTSSTIDALYRVRDNAKAEIVDGALVPMSPTGGLSGLAATAEMAAKRADYFAAGTRVVWDVDLISTEVVRVYRTDSPLVPTVYRRGAEAEAETAVPGWRMAVDELFE